MDPIVSIVIPAYNAAAFIRRSIASIQQQSLTDLEILVIDDASSDGTVAEVQALMAHDSRIRLFQQEQNGGVSVARNTGIAQSRGRYIAFLDADDMFLPQRLECLVAQVQAQDLDMVADNQVLHDSHLGRDVSVLTFNPTQAPQQLTTLSFLKGSNNIPTVREILSGNRSAHFPLIKPVIRRDFLSRHALQYDTNFPIGEDFDMVIRCLLAGAKAAIVPQALYVYTMSYSPVSKTRSLHSRTRFTMKPVLENVDQLLRTYADRLSPQMRQELRRCKYGCQGLEQFEQFKSELQRRRGWALLSFMINPTLWQYAARSSTSKLRNLSARRFA